MTIFTTSLIIALLVAITTYQREVIMLPENSGLEVNYEGKNNGSYIGHSSSGCCGASDNLNKSPALGGKIKCSDWHGDSYG
jgi:hypothetical protein